MGMVAERPRIALALQGGGAHGAYGWGALERLLEADLDIVAVSGASAGALNGAALVAGFATDGREGAKAGLERLWNSVAHYSPMRVLDSRWLPSVFLDPWINSSLQLAKLFGPYFLPLVPGVRGMDALRRIAGETIDLDALRLPNAIPLHISATRVADGTPRLFDNNEIDIDALMASACLPELFSAVNIDGEDHWDGGYSANPALDPLLRADGTTDLLILQITPFAVEDVSHSLPAMIGRISDIGFNACLLRDLKTLTEMQAALQEAPRVTGPLSVLREINLHLMQAAPELASRNLASKSDTRASKLQELRGIGYNTMDAWLAEHRDELGRRSTLTRPEPELA